MYSGGGNLRDVVRLLKYWCFSGLWAQRNSVLEIRAVLKNPGCVGTISGPGNLTLNFSISHKTGNQKQVTHNSGNLWGPTERLVVGDIVLYQSCSLPWISMIGHFYLLIVINYWHTICLMDISPALS